MPPACVRTPRRIGAFASESTPASSSISGTMACWIGMVPRIRGRQDECMARWVGACARRWVGSLNGHIADSIVIDAC